MPCLSPHYSLISPIIYSNLYILYIMYVSHHVRMDGRRRKKEATERERKEEQAESSIGTLLPCTYSLGGWWRRGQGREEERRMEEGWRIWGLGWLDGCQDGDSAGLRQALTVLPSPCLLYCKCASMWWRGGMALYFMLPHMLCVLAVSAGCLDRPPACCSFLTHEQHGDNFWPVCV